MQAFVEELAAHEIEASDFNVPDFEHSAEGVQSLFESLFDSFDFESLFDFEQWAVSGFEVFEGHLTEGRIADVAVAVINGGLENFAYAPIMASEPESNGVAGSK